MKKFNYFVTFSPYMNIVRAKNKKDAWEKLKKIWTEYNVKKIITLC